MALPFSGNGGAVGFTLVDRPPPEERSAPRAEINRADPWYFRAMEIPLRTGRVIEDSDRLGSQPVAVINESMARHWWPRANPLGRQIRPALPGVPDLTIVGVVGDTRHSALETPQADQIYVAFAQVPHIFGTLVVRTAGEPLSMTPAVREAVWSVDKDQPVWKIRTMESLLDNYIANRRFVAALLSGFSIFALILAAIGIYGVSSYWVEQRTREIGVRMALGARPGDIVRMVLGQSWRITVAGLVIGAAAGLVFTRLLASQLYAVTPYDPATFVTVSLTLAGVALLASFLPARRALRRDPVAALRVDA
jgi:putative ABC transport system permease protein